VSLVGPLEPDGLQTGVTGSSTTGTGADQIFGPALDRVRRVPLFARATWLGFNRGDQGVEMPTARLETPETSISEVYLPALLRNRRRTLRLGVEDASATRAFRDPFEAEVRTRRRQASLSLKANRRSDREGRCHRGIGGVGGAAAVDLDGADAAKARSRQRVAPRGQFFKCRLMSGRL